MKDNLIHKIFGTKAPLTRQEIDSSLGDNIDLPHKIELKMVDSSFESEAFEGFLEAGLTTASMTAMDRKMLKHLQSSSTQGFQNWFIGLWSVIFLLLIFSSKLLINEKKDENIVLANRTIHEDNILSSVTTEVTQTDIHAEKENERFTIHLSTKSSSQKPDQQASGQQNAIAQTAKHDDLPVRMEVQTAELINIRAKETGIKKPRAKEVALANFIFIDFRGIRSSNTFIAESLISGTGANLAHSNIKPDISNPTLGEIEVNYHDYLQETAFLMKDNNFKESIQRFKVILKHYPNDENALFYMAYCHFQLKQYKECLEYLEQLKKSTYGNFDEECDWYMLKTFQKLNRLSEAERLAEKIVELDGFYSEQARDFLRKR
jgi:TolA-binding protein